MNSVFAIVDAFQRAVTGASDQAPLCVSQSNRGLPSCLCMITSVGGKPVLSGAHEHIDVVRVTITSLEVGTPNYRPSASWLRRSQCTFASVS
jgi:hypothetical protein